MKIFYSGYSRKEDVPSSSPVEASQDDASDILWNLDFKGCFLGIELKDKWVLQVMNEEDYFFAEFLDRKNMDTISSNLGIEAVEKIMKEIYEGFEPMELIEKNPSNWMKGNLRKA